MSRSPQPHPPTRAFSPLFDPAKPQVQLLDKLAEEQAESLPMINSSQLRRFFGEIKDLYRRLESMTAGQSAEQRGKFYHERIEPQFKMMRSKVNYATRSGGRSPLQEDFARFIEAGVAKVSSVEHFKLFVLHFEAVVGFLYGKGKVNK